MTELDVIHEGDCLEVMPSLPDESVDMVLCDLPYGTTQAKWDEIIPLSELWAAYRRVTKPSAAIVLTASQPFTSMLVMSNPEWFRYDLVWRKNKSSGVLNANRMPLRTHETILVFYQSPPVYNPQYTYGHAPSNYARNHQQSGLYGKHKAVVYDGNSGKRHPQSVLDFKVVNNDAPDRIHPTQKPVDLFEWLIRAYTQEGAIVLDNAIGSGTTAVACIRSKRRFIGIEKDPDIADQARKRIEVVQVPLL